ncbi:Lysophospholipase, alpha-beta hydrolase superfamily [Pedococcus dokdonensis]|uniref:Lysophospholipase, alpha-beta hydrolase superfamily n=1 Tax=Pedococcus dokdonensis TaxID=443156 RepID=A0A1H0T059_9MICO|nr:alpha/beta fold hydrolase [Pedococcus dokdonensis]SDP47100.1 Lysophospholipase, alpha-beta hydrolase superfamily [Pedococcus dokdonensis]
MDSSQEPALTTQWRRVGDTWVRLLRFDPVVGEAGARGTVLLVPGLGLPRYLLPLARHLATQGAVVVVMDALAWRGRGRRTAPTIGGLAAVAAGVVSTLGPGPAVVFGHSTGAQAALEAVLETQAQWSGPSGRLALVMGGPTFRPDQRRWRRLGPAALTAYRKDTPKELVVLKDVARVRTDLVRIVQSGRRHTVEDRVPLLTVPLTLTAGEADSFATGDWLELLAARAGVPGRAVVLPGSHNNPFTHPELVGALVLDHLERPRVG